MRFYMLWKDDGPGLIGTEECVATDNEFKSLDFYLVSREKNLLKYLAQLNNLVKKNIKSKDRYKQQVAKEKTEERKTLPLHGQFERVTKA